MVESPRGTRLLFFVVYPFLLSSVIGLSGGITLRIGFIGSIDRIPYSEPIMRQAERQLKIDGIIPWHWRFEYYLSSLAVCDVQIDVLLKTKDLFEVNDVDVIFGPECTGGMTIAGLVAYAYQRPIFGYGSIDDQFSNKDKFPTLVRTSKTMTSLGAAVNRMLKYFQWDDVAVMMNSSKECGIATSGILGEITNKSSAINVKTTIVTDTMQTILNGLTTVKSVARIIIVCYGYDPTTANTFLLKANDAGMNTDEYVYIVPYYSRSTSEKPWPWLDTSLNRTDRDALLRMYRNVLVIESSGDDTATILDFRKYLKASGSPVDFEKNKTDSELSLATLFDSVYLYGLALNQTYEMGGNLSDGVTIASACQYVSFLGKSGKISMNGQSDRLCDYIVLSMNYSDEYTPLLSIPAAVAKANNSVSRDVKVLRSETFLTSDGVHPGDTPLCGFTMAKCIQNSMNTIIGASSGSFVVIALMSAAFIYYKRWKFERSLLKMSWKLNLDDVKLLSSQVRPSSGLWDRLSKRTDDETHSIIDITQVPEGDFFATFASVRGTSAFVKCTRRHKMPTLRREQLVLMRQIRTLQHDNLNTFLGAVIDDGPYVIACWKFAHKGSLLDVVMKDDIHLDDTFVASILKDVLMGLEYLHKSPLHYHGSLTVMNCVVDSRWIVKLTDFAWVQFKEHLRANQVFIMEDVPKPQKVYHSAPELLRNTVDASTIQTYHAGMRAADIYSLAFVIYHVIYKTEPLYDDVLTPDEIIRRIKKTGTDPLRPHTAEMSEANPKLVSLMHRCWNEDPHHRPTVAEIKTSFVQTFGGDIMRRSLLDHMMSILEKYATNLEKVVEERTIQLETERRRADQLLYQMLPRAVADLLKGGLNVEPESYECVTIYFSDIVGFTSLSSESTPMEVVTMLNKLYSEFDETLMLFDCYKVETIGDAYMVVSGLPHRNGGKHVFEICDMSLAIMKVVYNFKVPHKPGRRLRLRIGVHSGSVASGVVGLTMPRFCLFGDTVNTASRMESNGEPSKIHISENTRRLLLGNPEYVVELRGDVSIKGKGLVTTYWLMEKRDWMPGEIPG